MRTLWLGSVFVIVLGMLGSGVVRGEELVVSVDLPDIGEYQITDTQSGQKVGFESCGFRVVPGSLMLPTKTYLVALPPGTRATEVDVQLVGSYEFAGTFPLARTAEPVRLDGRAVLNEVAAAGPTERGWISGSGSLREYRYVVVTVCPCSYDRVSGRLTCYGSAEIKLTCEPDPAQIAAPDPKTDIRAQSLFVNFDQVRNLYHQEAQQTLSPQQTYDYVIITASTQAAAVTASTFIPWKTSLGYSVRMVLITDPEITSQPGADLAEQIRNFLRAYYTAWGIEYVLLVGNYVRVPMRYCYPDSSNHTNTAGTPGGSGGEVPTDYYYADLSSSDATSWDSDGDGYHGEYGQDNVDLMPEVYVGRIPKNNAAAITYALNKTVTFEQDTGAWKHNALHAGAFWYFTGELSDTSPCMDAAHYLSYIEADIMTGWTVSKYTEQAGLEISAYPGNALTHAALTTDWRTGQYAVMNWGAHGWTDRVGRKVWDFDDGDGVPEADEISWPDMIALWSSLDDDYPSVVTSASCLVGCPEPNSWGNMGIDMLTLEGWGPSIGVISSARSPYGSAYWPPGGSESIIYEFNDLMINGGEKVGEAFYNSKFYCNTNYGWDHYAEYINMYTFNLFGDPSLTLEGIDVAAVEPGNGDGEVKGGIRLAAGPSPARGTVTISYYLPSASQPSLDVFDVLGRNVCTLDAPGDAGAHEIAWDGLNADGRATPSGVYWIRLSLAEEARTARIVRIE